MFLLNHFMSPLIILLFIWMFNFAIALETLSAFMTGIKYSKRTSIIRLSYFCASRSARILCKYIKFQGGRWAIIAKNNTYVEQVKPKLFGWCQTVFTELHSYLIPARGDGVPPRLIFAGGRRSPGKKGGGTAFPRVPPGKHHWVIPLISHVIPLISQFSAKSHQISRKK
jgi:hypothetical protein